MHKFKPRLLGDDKSEYEIAATITRLKSIHTQTVVEQSHQNEAVVYRVVLNQARQEDLN